MNRIEFYRRFALISPVIGLILVLVTASFVSAEQIVINDDVNETKVAGDFKCYPCYQAILNDSSVLDFTADNLTTGDLFRYLKSRGVNKMDRLELRVDFDCDPDNSQSVCVTGLSFQIEDESHNLLTDKKFGENELMLDSNSITSFKPEAVLELDLGYDFMQRFSEDSTEAVVLNFATDGTGREMKPRILLSQDMTSFSSDNLIRILLFIGFWGVVFYLAHFFTRSGNRLPSPATRQTSVPTA